MHVYEDTVSPPVIQLCKLFDFLQEPLLMRMVGESLRRFKMEFDNFRGDLTDASAKTKTSTTCDFFKEQI